MLFADPFSMAGATTELEVVADRAAHPATRPVHTDRPGRTFLERGSLRAIDVMPSFDLNTGSSPLSMAVSPDRL